MAFGGISHEKRMLKRIGRYLEEGKVKELMAMLGDRTPGVVVEVLKALGNIAYDGDAGRITWNNGISRIGVCLTHPERMVRLYATRTLCWVTVKTSATELISAGILSSILPLLSDDEPDTVRYALAMLGEVIDANQTIALVNAEGIGPIGSLVMSRDEYTSQLAIMLLGKLGEQGYGSQVVGSGSARLLVLASQMGDSKTRSNSEASLKVLCASMGYSDPETFKAHIQDAEKMAGRKQSFEPAPGRSLDTVFYGGATGVSTIDDGVRHSEEEIGTKTEEMDDDEEFVVDETEIFPEEEFDVDLDIVEEAEREFPFNILMERLREVKSLSEEGVINPTDYYHIKSRVIQDVGMSIELECMNCYDVLEIDFQSGPDEVKRAYRKLASQYHPDKVATLGPKLKKMALEEMTKLNHAKQILLDPERRMEHDRVLMGTWGYQ